MKRFSAGSSQKGFSLIEMMVVVLIIGLLTVFAIDEYFRYIEQAKVTKAKVDLEELSKAIKMFTFKEDKPFAIATFTSFYLGNFIGNYLEKDPPLDPWNQPYHNNPNLGILYSFGPDGVDGIQGARISTDDVIFPYLPEGFYLTKAEYIDANRNNQLDFGDFLEMSLSKPGRFASATPFDFETRNPAQSFGSARLNPPLGGGGQIFQIEFAPPLAPTLVLNTTSIAPREFIESIQDYSREPRRLATMAVTISRKRM